MRNTQAKQLKAIIQRSRRSGALDTVALTSLLILVALASQAFLFSLERANSIPARAEPIQVEQNEQYLYYVLKDLDGFVLARAHEGASHEPIETPITVAHFGNDFGLSSTDSVISLQLSPNRRYLAIDGTRSDGELVWVFDTVRQTLTLMPADASGTFLHWLPGPDPTFLYRPMFPMGSGGLLSGQTWNPGLWKVNADTASVTTLNISAPAAYLVDAAASPDGSQIVYSVSDGLGLGSTVWSMTSDGEDQKRLFTLAGNEQSIAGIFSWSPDGHTIAYERLADSATPFRPAGLWIMNDEGHGQRTLAQADGGHGFAPSWSPDGENIAFVARTNPQESQADLRPQALESSIEVVDLENGQVATMAGPAQTGSQINANPLWTADSASITFTAFNPLNPITGGTPHYWSVSARSAEPSSRMRPFSQPLTRVVALE